MRFGWQTVFIYMYIYMFHHVKVESAISAFFSLHNMNKTENLLEAIKANLYLVHV